MKAIIIFYQGSTIQDVELKNFVRSIVDFGRKIVGVTLMKDDEVAAATVRNTTTTEASVEEVHTITAPITAEDNAAIYVGTIMEEELKHFNPGVLIASLTKRMNDAKKQPNKKANREFMNALFILAQTDLCISREILEKYNLNAEKLLLIKETYNFVSKY